MVATDIYRPNEESRNELWASLSGVNLKWLVPWCFGGDFNMVWFPRIGKGGLLPVVRRKFSDKPFLYQKWTLKKEHQNKRSVEKKTKKWRAPWSVSQTKWYWWIVTCQNACNQIKCEIFGDIKWLPTCWRGPKIRITNTPA